MLGGGDGCATTPSDDDPATVTYRLPARRHAFTLLGAPTIIAGLGVVSDPGAAQVAGRLWDVAPGGGPQTLVARGAYRPHGGMNVWQLHPAAWRFAPGHVAKLELLGNDVPYGRQSNGSFQVEVRRLQLRLPVRQRPDCHAVRRVARPLLPEGDAPGAGRGSLAPAREGPMPAPLIEFPADDPERARRFWAGLLGVELAPRAASAGSGWETERDGLRLGVHERGTGPGDTGSLPYLAVEDIAAALERVRELGGSVIHPGERWAICRDSEGSPFALAAAMPESGPADLIPSAAALVLAATSSTTSFGTSGLSIHQSASPASPLRSCSAVGLDLLGWDR